MLLLQQLNSTTGHKPVDSQQKLSAKFTDSSGHNYNTHNTTQHIVILKTNQKEPSLNRSPNYKVYSLLIWKHKYLVLTSKSGHNHHNILASSSQSWIHSRHTRRIYQCHLSTNQSRISSGWRHYTPASQSASRWHSEWQEIAFPFHYCPFVLFHPVPNQKGNTFTYSRTTVWPIKAVKRF